MNVIPAQAGDKHPLQQGINSDFDPVTSRISGSRSQTSYRERLTKENYSVEVAEDGHVAEKMVQQQFFDAIITDLIMPGDIGGLEVLDIAKKNNSITEVVLITANSSVNTALQAMKKGANDYLEKPVNFDEFFLRLEKIANMQTILRSAQDLQVAVDTTENEASSTIQTLEVQVAQLQGSLDTVETVLRDDQLPDDIKIDKSLAIIANI